MTKIKRQYMPKWVRRRKNKYAAKRRFRHRLHKKLSR